MITALSLLGGSIVFGAALVALNQYLVAHAS